VLLLDHGNLLKDDTSENSCNLFYELSDKQIALNKQHAQAKKVDSSGDLDVDCIEILDALSSKPLDRVAHGTDVIFRIHLQVHNPLRQATLGFGIHTTDFIYLCASGHSFLEDVTPGHHVLDCCIRGFPLLPRTYGLRIGINAGERSTLMFYGEGLLNFLVTEKDSNRAEASESFIHLDAKWQFVQ
jgi:hypothetical protein